jgi:hypothetical protein
MDGESFIRMFGFSYLAIKELSVAFTPSPMVNV